MLYEVITISFYQTAFDGVTAASQTNADLSSSNQIWFLKEMFNFVAMIGFFLSIVPILSLLIKLPFLKNAVTAEKPVVALPSNVRQKIVFWITIAVGGLFPAVLFVITSYSIHYTKLYDSGLDGRRRPGGSVRSCFKTQHLRQAGGTNWYKVARRRRICPRAT